MLYNDFKGQKLSRLGFGMMRLPVDENGKIDEAKTEEMIDYAMAHGVNYFDTAWPYHNGYSEVYAGKYLNKYPRDSFYLADKYPGHQFAKEYNPKDIFEKQLEKCGVDYFDFYLLHNVCEADIDVYESEKWGIINYFIEQKRLGKIKYLGFSSHADIPCLDAFLDKYSVFLDFCQIQLNYLDWTLQKAAKKYEIITNHGLGVWVMEPVRGGRLAKLDEADEKLLKGLRPDESIASWCFRFLQQLPNCKVVLSGMSSLEQMKDNIKTYEEYKPLSDKENEALINLGLSMQHGVPCTACGYCKEGCPMHLDIPRLMHFYNELEYANTSVNVGMRIDTLKENEMSSACIACGKCKRICPQKIDIPETMKKLTEMHKKVPKWADICKQREEDAKRLYENKK